MPFYHFTSHYHLHRILPAGVLKPSESNVGSPIAAMQPFGEHFGPDVVWLLDVPALDYPHGLTGCIYDKTKVRFEVDVPAVRWLEWEPARKMHPRWTAALIRLGGGQAAARHWYVYEGQIDSRRWLSVTRFQESKGRAWHE